MKIIPAPVLVIAIALTLLSCSQTQSEVPNVPLPPGPYSSWAPEARDIAVRSLRRRCADLAVATFVHFRASKEIAGPGETAYMFACIVKAMPDDWPERAWNFQQYKKAYETAKSIDLALLDPMTVMPSRDVLAGRQPGY